MRLFNTIATVFPALSYILVSLAPVDKPIISVILFGSIIGSIGVNAGGFYKCGALISRQVYLKNGFRCNRRYYKPEIKGFENMFLTFIMYGKLVQSSLFITAVSGRAKSPLYRDAVN